MYRGNQTKSDSVVIEDKSRGKKSSTWLLEIHHFTIYPFLKKKTL